MLNAVRTYADTENPNNFPGDVICEILLVDDSTSSPPEGYSSLMTDEQIAAYIDAHADSYASFQFMSNNLKIWEQTKTLRRDGIKGRIEWAHEVILDFRDYAVAKNLSAADSVSLLQAVSGCLIYLQLGLLGPAALVINAFGPNSFLDASMDGSVFGVDATGLTVKQYFLNKILEGNV